MFSRHVIAPLIGILLFSLLLACGQTRWFGKKFHQAVFTGDVLEGLPGGGLSLEDAGNAEERQGYMEVG